MLYICFMIVVALLSAVLGNAALETSGCEYQHCYVVNNSASTGLGSLGEALTAARTYNSSVEIRLVHGTFQLPGNGVVMFQEWNNFTIVGLGSSKTTIACNGNMGLFFNSSRNLKFLNASLTGCGFEFDTTSVNLTKLEGSDEISFLKSKTGMLFNSCSNLRFEDFSISDSNGTGITIYNTDGYNLFRDCQISDNFMQQTDFHSFPGGGGIIIESSHCYPGDSGCEDSTSVVKETVGASYIFEHCKFALNRAYSRGVFSASFPHGRSHMDLGKGGGLSITLKGRAFGNQVMIKSCTFNLNFGKSGGAFHLSFGDQSINNSVVVVDNSLFESNSYQILQDHELAGEVMGGAVRVTMVSFPKQESSELWGGYVSEVYGNSVNFTDVVFNGNFASWGGAVSFVTTRNVPGQVQSNSLHFTRCIFMQNRATLAASAVDISAWKPEVIGNRESYMMPVFEDCSFLLNELSFTNITNRPVGLGAVYVAGLPTEYRGKNLFYQNTDTSLVISDAYVNISHSGVLNFTCNTGRRGGALAFIGDSWLVMGENTLVLFDSNSVGIDGYGFGGAVYAVHFGDHDLVHRQDCFFQYYKFGEPPSRWNATFMFINNTANSNSNSIYTTSLAPCVWSDSGLWDDRPATDAFCDNSTWIFDGVGRNCHNEITTGPSKIEVHSIDVDVVPGWKKHLNINTYDDYNNFIPTALLASTNGGQITVADTTRYILDDEIIIYGSPDSPNNELQNLLLMTPDPRVVASTLRIKVLDCPVGFRPVNCSDASSVGQTCDCVCHDAPGISCDYFTKDVYVYKYNCVSPTNDNSSLLAISICPYNQLLNISLYAASISNVSDYVCSKYYREGFLCSKCLPGYGVSINSYNYKCVECVSSMKYNWLLFLLLELGPTTVVCFIVVLFGVSLASPYMNAFVFFSQIVSVKYFHNSYCWLFGVDYINSSLSKPITLFYGMWNLDFFREFVHICLHVDLNTLHVLLINYIKAFYPMVVLLFCYACIKLYDRNVRFVRFLWKPLRYCVRTVNGSHKRSTSIVDAFTTLLILSYTKILYVSFPLVTQAVIYETMRDGSTIEIRNRYYFYPSVSIYSESFFYFMFGVIALVILVGIPPFLLLIYSCSFLRSRIGKLNTRLRIAIQIFGDSFFKGFRDGTDGGADCRWFGAAYLFFRVIVFVIYAAQQDWLAQYLIQQILCILAIFLFAVARPYKVDFFNFLDISFFVLLSILNILSLYNSQQVIITTNEVQKGVFYVNYILIYLPLVYLICLVLYLLLFQRIKHKFTMTRKIMKAVGETSSYIDDETYDREENLSYDDNDVLPDRLIHPDHYSSLNPKSAVSMQNAAKKIISQRARTDKSYFAAAGKRGPKTAAYGSVTK